VRGNEGDSESQRKFEIAFIALRASWELRNEAESALELAGRLGIGGAADAAVMQQCFLFRGTVRENIAAAARPLHCFAFVALARSQAARKPFFTGQNRGNGFRQNH
jgi:hypothetical protein